MCQQETFWWSLQEGNWPLLTVSKGFFETLAAKSKAADGGKPAAAAAAAAGALDEEALDGAGWGDDLGLDLGGVSHTTTVLSYNSTTAFTLVAYTRKLVCIPDPGRVCQRRCINFIH